MPGALEPPSSSVRASRNLEPPGPARVAAPKPRAARKRITPTLVNANLEPPSMGIAPSADLEPPVNPRSVPRNRPMINTGSNDIDPLTGRPFSENPGAFAPVNSYGWDEDNERGREFGKRMYYSTLVEDVINRKYPHLKENPDVAGIAANWIDYVIGNNLQKDAALQMLDSILEDM